MKEIKILGKAIRVDNDFMDIHELKFLKDNPRVYACTHKEPNFDRLPEKEQQEIIYKNLIEEPSVKKLEPEIKRHGGLLESILIRHDTKEVIEGNSRLAVYRKLARESEQTNKQDDNWSFIQCEIVSGLTDPEQTAYLNQIHVKGKTQWSAYEKANFAYVRKDRGWKVNEIAKLFGVSVGTVRMRIKAVEMMKENEDNERSHFSYYDVLVRNKEIIEKMEKSGGLNNILSDIKQIGSQTTGTEETDNAFTAQDLRNKLPVVLKKPKVLKKYIAREIYLDDAYQRAKISNVEENVKKATELLNDVSLRNLVRLEQNEFKAFKYATNKLFREVDRLKKATQDRDSKQ